MDTRMSEPYKKGWRQMLTPHQMADISTTPIENHLDARPSQSPVLGTETTLKTDELLKTNEYSESQKTKSNKGDQNLMKSYQDTLSSNPNLNSMIKTIGADEMNFYRQLEQKYFQKAQKEMANSPSLSSQICSPDD